MLTKTEKEKRIKEGEKLLGEHRGVIFIDFTGANMERIMKLRRTLRECGATLKVIKKKLLRIAFQNKKIDFNPEQFESQVGTVFVSEEIAPVAASVYKSGIVMLGGYETDARHFIDADKMKFIGNLPSREALLGQFAGVLAAPIRIFLYVLNEKRKRVEE